MISFLPVGAYLLVPFANITPFYALNDSNNLVSYRFHVFFSFFPLYMGYSLCLESAPSSPLLLTISFLSKISSSILLCKKLFLISQPHLLYFAYTYACTHIFVHAHVLYYTIHVLYFAHIYACLPL